MSSADSKSESISTCSYSSSSSSSSRSCFPVVPLDKTRSVFDNQNTSTRSTLSQNIRGKTMKTIYQGQPFGLSVSKISYNSARIHFQYIGTPQHYTFTLYRENVVVYDKKFTHAEYVRDGYFLVQNMDPNTIYQLDLVAVYISSDFFYISKYFTFRTRNLRFALENIDIQLPTNTTTSTYETGFHIYGTANPTPSGSTTFSIKVRNKMSGVLLKDYFIGGINDEQQPLQIMDNNKITITDVSFNTEYDVIFQSDYHDTEDSSIATYIFTKTIRTTTEQLSYLDISYIRNTGADFSYSPVDISDAVYKLYVNNEWKQSDSRYTGQFSITGLDIGKKYENVFIAVYYPTSGNEYQNRIIPDFSFTTLNQRGFEFGGNIAVTNSSIDVSYTESTSAVFTLTGFLYSSTLYSSIGTHIYCFNDLSIGTPYNLSIKKTYPPVNMHDISNQYIVQQNISTLNEGPITNVRVSKKTKGNSNLLTVTYDPSPGTPTIISTYILPTTTTVYKNDLYLVGQYSDVSLSFLSHYQNTTDNRYIYNTRFNPMDIYDISSITLSDTTAEIVWPNTIIENFTVQFRGVDTQVSNKTCIFSDLSLNTQYSFKFRKSDETLWSEFDFTTLHQKKSVVDTNTFYQFGGVPITVINVENTNAGDVSDNKISINQTTDTTMGTTKTIQSTIGSVYTGSVLTRYRPIPNNGYYYYTNKEYITDFSFTALMKVPEYIVTSSSSIKMQWYSNTVVSQNGLYVINVRNSVTGSIISTIPDIRGTDLSCQIIHLSPSTSYDISMISQSNPSIVFAQTIVTSNNETSDISAATFSASGTAVFFATHTNIADISFSTIRILNQTQTNYVRHDINQVSSLFDISNITVLPSGYIYGNITTEYQVKPSTQLNVQYASVKVSKDFSLCCISEYRNENQIQNGQTFSASSWIGRSILLSNENSGNFRTKYFRPEERDISNNIVLYRGNSQQLPFLTQHLPYILKGWNSFCFFVGNHFDVNQPYSSGVTYPTVEYQFVISKNAKVVYASNPILSADSSLNKIIINFEMDYSLEEVDVTIQRKRFENNDLYLSNISLFGKDISNDNNISNQTFYKKEIVENTTVWITYQPQSTWKNVVKKIMIQDHTYALSTNMTISFWLYVHDLSLDDCGIFVVGGTSIFLRNNKLSVTTNGVLRYQDVSFCNIPCHYYIVFDRTTCSVYKNYNKSRVFDDDVTVVEVKDAIPSDIVSFGDKYGFLTKNMKLYNYPINKDLVTALSVIEKTFIANTGEEPMYSDISKTVVVLSSYSSYSYSSDIVHSTLNGKELEKRLILNHLSNVYVDTNIDTRVRSISFWCTSIDLSANGFTIYRSESSISLSTRGSSSSSSASTISITSSLSKIHHFAWTFDGFLCCSYLNGYLYSQTASSLTDLSINTIHFSSENKIAELVTSPTVFTQSEVLTIYMKYFDIDYIYDMSGKYQLKLQIPNGTNIAKDTSLNFGIVSAYKLYPSSSSNISLISGNTYTVRYSDPIINTPINIDFSMSRTDLNGFNKSGFFNFVLYDYNVKSNIVSTPSTPYLESTKVHLDESSNLVIVQLYNTPSGVEYKYQMEGTNVNADDFNTPLSGNISSTYPTTINMREDYKTEGLEFFTFSVATLGLSLAFDVSDSTQNLLQLQINSSNENSFNIKLPSEKVPEKTQPYEYTITEIGRAEPFVSESGFFYETTDTLYFNYGQNDNNPVSVFKLSLSNYPGSVVSVFLYDILVPVLSFTISNETINYANEGDTVRVQLKVPYKNLGDVFYYAVSGGAVDRDDLGGGDMSGAFLFQNNKYYIDFSMAKNRIYSEGTEEFRIHLVSDVYEEISSGIPILDTFTPPSYRWVITRNYPTESQLNNPVNLTNVNEGESFYATLVTDNVENNTSIDYAITGVNASDLLGGLLRGSVIVGSSNVILFTIAKDTTTDGEKIMRLSTVGLAVDSDVFIVLNDTSQQPTYTLTIEGLNSKKEGDTCVFVLSVKNYTILTSIQQQQQLSYSVFPSGMTDSASFGSIVLSAGNLFNNVMVHTFSFKLKPGSSSINSGIFNFEIAGLSYRVSVI